MFINILSFAINMIIMIGVVSFFSAIGQVINKKYFASRFKYSPVIGFITFIASFQLLSFPFILLQTKYTSFVLVAIPFMLIWIGYLWRMRKLIKFDISNLKAELIMIIIWFGILAFRSIIFSDSWLYSVMISSTIENNLIFSNDGFTAFTQLNIMHHRFESYYLWQALLSSLFIGNYLLVLVTEYKLFDAVILILSLMELGYQFNLKRSKAIMFTVFIIVMMSSADTIIDGSWMQTTEPPVQLFQISTGTALYHILILPFLLIYTQLNYKLNWCQKKYFWILFVVAFSAMSTTFYYTLPLYFSIWLIVKHIYYKQKDQQILFAFGLTWIIIIASFTGVFTQSLAITSFLICGLLLVLKLVLMCYRKLSTRAVSRLTILAIATYLVLIIYNYNQFAYTNGSFTTDKQLLRIRNIIVNIQNGDIASVIIPIIMLVLLIVACFGLISSKQKKYQRAVGFGILYLILFFNNASICFYYQIGIGPVVSRIAAASLWGYTVSLYVIERLTKYLVVDAILITYTILGISSILNSAVSYHNTKQTYIDSVNGELGQLARYDYLPNSFYVVDNLDATVGNEHFYQGINKLVVLRPDLSWNRHITSCEQLSEDKQLSAEYSNCYTIYNKQKRVDKDYVFETENYLVSKDV